MSVATPTSRTRLAIGAEPQPDGSTRFRVWAPAARTLMLVLYGPAGEERDVDMSREGDGHFVTEAAAGAGVRYCYRLNGELVADPASRFQPEGPFGPSQVVDAGQFAWSDAGWPGLSLPGQVLYELHVGTFTREGTWAAAATRLPHLAETGITAIEVMPSAEFPGRFGWGYDGVFPYAPFHGYGTPDEFREFVDRAHALGMGVVLDVVYNHLGPEGSVFQRFAPGYFSRRYEGEWGDPLNFDDEASAPVREFFIGNAATWIREFHLDGLRLDATQGIHDASAEHVLAAIGTAAREAAGTRAIVLIAENETQHARLIRPLDRGGYGLDGLWNDDFHHSAVVAATGRREAYYTDYAGTAQELVSCAKYGYLFQGQRYAWQKNPRGAPARGIRSSAFVHYIENHDQIANSGKGERLRFQTSPGRYRALSALFLLMPGTPMLFQGQEFGARTPFHYFADLSPELAVRVEQGRAEFVSQFLSLATPEAKELLKPPHDPATFEQCVLDWEDRDEAIAALFRDLIALRRGTPVLASGNGPADGSSLSSEVLVLRYFADEANQERLLFVNLGRDFIVPSIADPLVAPPEGAEWRLAWSSEAPEYGGIGTPAVVGDHGWRLPGHAAVVLEPVDASTREQHA